jgi:hypothetical protein
MTSRAYYSDLIERFALSDPAAVLGQLAENSDFAIEGTQRDAWLEQIKVLRNVLESFAGQGKVYFEYSIPRLGKRIDVLVILKHVIFVIEFKVGESEFKKSAIDQVYDYALDLKNFHETSHFEFIAPVLVATRARECTSLIKHSCEDDRLLEPICSTVDALGEVLEQVLAFCSGKPIESHIWEHGRYSPTPTIIEAALALYGGHLVEDISRNDASAINLSRTSGIVSKIIQDARQEKYKAICFVTGVPGAGKTLVGLNIATTHMDPESELHSVFLSGNGPLVSILCEALARDKVARGKNAGGKVLKGRARTEVKSFVQNVHHFRDECLSDTQPPHEHVVLFDEAQRAWNLKQTASFMDRKKGVADFGRSEPEFLISCMDRHPDWAVIVCLVGGGQEINTGEAGIKEWVQAVLREFPAWKIHISSRLNEAEYGAGAVLESVRDRPGVTISDELHLSVSMRSFRAERVSALVKQVLDLDEESARRTLSEIGERYPIVITQDIQRAKAWLKKRARGSERFGIVASSQAQRLKPFAIDVKSPMDPIHWFLDGKDDVRSSYYLEDVATEFHVQGLELDWVCLAWDADFRYSSTGWVHRTFSGSKWNNINAPERQEFLKNAYRVLLTRARQGMVIFVPQGDDSDPTRRGALYDPTYEYLERLGFKSI